MSNPCFDYQFRIILIGDSMVGKSSLVSTFIEGKFTNACEPTIGVDFSSRTINLANGQRIKLQLWDSAGQEKFRSISRNYYRNAVGALLIFDITNRDTFEHLNDWYSEALACMRCSNPTFILVGHKHDMESQREVCNYLSHIKVTQLEGELAAEKMGSHDYIETSAVNGYNVQNVFKLLAETIYNNVVAGGFNEFSNTSDWDGVKKGQSDMVTHLKWQESASAEAKNGCCS